MTADPLLGRTLAGFTVEALIGRGGMGSVYRAEQPRLARKVALKVLSPELAENAEFRGRFLAESRTAAAIDHPNILPVYEAGEEGGLLYIAMRLVEGTHTDLQALLEREGALRPERALAICAQVASALDAAHARGLVHRDVKPGNVLLAGDHAYLTDFGIAKVTTGRRELTRTGAFLGTLDYAGPEQIRNEPVDGASDIYALGAVLFHCLSGHVPYDRPSDYGVMKAHLEEPPPRVPAGDLPPTLDAVFAVAMAKAKDERYRSGRHLIEAARAAIAGEVVPGPVASVRPTVVDRPVVTPTVVQAGVAPTAAARTRETTRLPSLVTLGLALASVATFGYFLWEPMEASTEVATGANVSALVRDPKTGTTWADATFPSVSAPGRLVVALTTRPPAIRLPPGFAVANGRYYELTSTAAFSGMATVCFADNSVTAQSKLYHLYGGEWIDRTTSAIPPSICGSFPSFSPVVIVQGSPTPTPTATRSPTPTPLPTRTVSPTPTLSPTPAPSPTPTPEPRTTEPSRRYRVSGTVRDSTFNLAVADALIIAYPLSDPSSVAGTANTDSSGNFSLSVPANAYRLRVSSAVGAFPAQDWSGTVTVDGDRIGLTVRVTWPSSRPRENGRVTGQAPYMTVAGGSTVTTWFTIVNTGTTTWRARGVDGYGYRGLFEWAGRSFVMCCDFAPGGADTFQVQQVVPTTPGLYRYGAILTHNGIDFGPAFFLDVTVRSPSANAPAPVFGNPLAGGGWSASYAGESVFLNKGPGEAAQFSAIFFNDGSQTWSPGVVGLLVCLPDKNTCNVTSPNAAYASAWYSSAVYATVTAIVAPGQNGFFIYNFVVPPGTPPGTQAVFYGDVGLIGTGARLRPEGYYQINTAR